MGKAHQITLNIYRFSTSFLKEEMYSLTNQLRRASAFIPANIAEGCGRNTKADLAHFLNISFGSTNETEYFLILAKDLNYLSEEQFSILSNNVNEVKAMLISLITKVRLKHPNLELKT